MPTAIQFSKFPIQEGAFMTDFKIVCYGVMVLLAAAFGGCGLGGVSECRQVDADLASFGGEA